MTDETKNDRVILRELQVLCQGFEAAVRDARLRISDLMIEKELADLHYDLPRLRHDYIEGCIGLCDQRIDDKELYQDGNAEHRKDFKAATGVKEM